MVILCNAWQGNAFIKVILNKEYFYSFVRAHTIRFIVWGHALLPIAVTIYIVDASIYTHRMWLVDCFYVPFRDTCCRLSKPLPRWATPPGTRVCAHESRIAIQWTRPHLCMYHLWNEVFANWVKNLHLSNCACKTILCMSMLSLSTMHC